ncbi:MAG: T9SS type A sorting domain-containing protein [Acidobacteriota bacterium]
MKHRILVLALLLASFAAVSPAAPVIAVPTTYPTIQAAIDAAAPGTAINIAPGTYHEQLVITKSVTLSGVDRATVIIDASGFPGNAVICRVSDVTIQHLTLKGNPTPSGAAGFKMEGVKANTTPGVTQDGARAQNIVISDVSVMDCYRCGIDYNGISSGIITDVSVTGSVNQRGISIVDCDHITLHSITGSGNNTADIGITASGQYFPGGVSFVTIEGTNSFNGANADVYTEIDNIAYSITDLDLSTSGLHYRAFQAGESKVAYHTTLELAVSRAVSYTSPGSIVAPAVADINSNTFYVQGGLTIGNALAVAPAGSTINIAAGTYDESIEIDKELHFGAVAGTAAPLPDIAIPPITLTDLYINYAGGFTLSGPIKITHELRFIQGNLYTSQTNFIELGSEAYVSGETATKMIVGDVHTQRMLMGSDAAPGAEYFGGIGVTITELKENLGLTTIIRRTGPNVGIENKTIDRVWLLYGKVTPTKDGTITLDWFSTEDNGILFAAAGAKAQAYRSMTGDVTGSDWTTIGPITDASAMRSITFPSMYGGYYTVSNTDLPLPVELTSFTAKTAAKKVMLAWSTATEKNNHGFEIERRASGNTNAWEKVGFVQGAGTTNTPQSYAYIDQATAGTFEYRLKQIDRDGKFQYSQTVEAAVAFTAEDYTVTQNYPNPFNPATTIRFAVRTAQQAVVKVYNAIGQEVRTLFNQTAQPETMYSVTFDATGLPSGSYYYVLRTAERTDVRRMLLLK